MVAFTACPPAGARRTEMDRPNCLRPANRKPGRRGVPLDAAGRRERGRRRRHRVRAASRLIRHRLSDDGGARTRGAVVLAPISVLCSRSWASIAPSYVDGALSCAALRRSRVRRCRAPPEARPTPPLPRIGNCGPPCWPPVPPARRDARANADLDGFAAHHVHRKGANR
jgi:hypothetical protein